MKLTLVKIGALYIQNLKRTANGHLHHSRRQPVMKKQQTSHPEAASCTLPPPPNFSTHSFILLSVYLCPSPSPWTQPPPSAPPSHWIRCTLWWRWHEKLPHYKQGKSIWLLLRRRPNSLKWPGLARCSFPACFSTLLPQSLSLHIRLLAVFHEGIRGANSNVLSLGFPPEATDKRSAGSR